jgi:hypothetical protein
MWTATKSSKRFFAPGASEDGVLDGFDCKHFTARM